MGEQDLIHVLDFGPSIDILKTLVDSKEVDLNYALMRHLNYIWLDNHEEGKLLKDTLKFFVDDVDKLEDLVYLICQDILAMEYSIFATDECMVSEIHREGNTFYVKTVEKVIIEGE